VFSAAGAVPTHVGTVGIILGSGDTADEGGDNDNFLER